MTVTDFIYLPIVCGLYFCFTFWEMGMMVMFLFASVGIQRRSAVTVSAYGWPMADGGSAGFGDAF